MRVLDDQHLIYNEKTNRQARHNLEENGNAAVLQFDLESGQAYRFEGKAHIYSEGQLFDEALAAATKDKQPIPRAVVVIDMERIYNLGSYRYGDYLLAGEPYEDAAK
jgi:predicted pyridoxine 5'-phosphate oxidase superfamily flavin-nucleotide-binding protein